VTSEHSLRARRVAQSIKKVVTDFLARDVGDPALAGVVVTDVELTADLGLATIKARLFAGGDDAGQRRVVMKSLARAGGRLRRHLGSALRLKRVPEIRFVYDVGADAARRVEELLADIAREKKGV
jgi:ribosome-binding factor A